ncbi:ABC transporter permease [Cardinium endosymbiont of Bemisia tabaci]|uniref:ABC transporter permease n=1 Tax=Candidatus Cardinium TaxID=273135 RepID=UPI000442D247|nr:FtsX-like permease family protein [Cardinium endosymbiont of Bemisia tabaci]CDG49752.1 FtsX-like permease family protein [Cardinium endosymbiont cBtQ1 of Bemisia tabaci]
MQISFFIAKRYVKKQGKITLMYRLSRLACYSMVLGTAILLLVLATMNGMQKLLSALFYTYTPVLKIERQTEKTFLSDKDLKKQIMYITGVSDIVEVLEATALTRLFDHQAIVTIKGVSNNFTSSDFYKNCKRMDGVAFLGDNRAKAMAGIGVAQFLQWTTHNNKVEVFYPKQDGHHLYKPYKRTTLEIDGLFSIAPPIDCKYIIAPIRFVEGLTNGLNKRTHWEVVIDATAEVQKMQINIEKLLPKGYKVTNQTEQNATRRRAIFIERLSVCFIFALVLLLASLHIFFMLCMSILQKQKDMAILVSLGATPGEIGKIFFYNGMLVALKGILYGLMLGWGLAFLQQKFGIVTFTKVSHLMAYPVAIHPFDFIYTAMVTTLFSLLATIWPVKRAMQFAKKSLDGIPAAQ